LTTPTSQHDTYTAHSSQSAAPAPNHQSDHTAEANAKTAKGHATMFDIQSILKEIDDIKQQLEVINEILKGNEPSA
jgi:hypothetical protein